MSNRYWVGGTNDWNATAGTKWASTSGGAGGQSVPTSADDTFFDANSGSSVITLTFTGNVKSLNCNGFTGTLKSDTARNIVVSGSGTSNSANVVFSATMTSWGSLNLQMNFSADCTITNNGHQWLGSLLVNGSSGNKVSFLDSFYSSGQILHYVGELNFNNQSVRTVSYNANTSGGARVLTMTSSTLTLVASDTNFTPTSGTLTVSAGTSTILFTGSTCNMYPGGNTFNNITITGTGTFNFYNSSVTMATLTIGAGKTVQFSTAMGRTYTITDLVSNGTSGSFAVILGDTPGTGADLQKTSGTVTVSNISIKDIAASGGATFNVNIPYTNAGGNTGWNFQNITGGSFIPFL